jgi:hypothetical protein
MRAARFLLPVFAGVAAMGFAACTSTTAATATLFNDSTTTVDVATSAGDAAATAVETMTANETAAGASANYVGSGALSANPASALFSATPANALTITRTRTCLNGDGVVVAGCSPFTSVRKVVTHVTADGTRSSSTTTTGGTSATWSGSVHRVSNDTMTRVFNTASPAVETSRIHTDLTTGHDTTAFTEATLTRNTAEVSHDSVKAVTFNLPRSSNPYPVSGSIVRVDSVHVALTKGTLSETKDLVRVVTITFPADAQGNVVLTVNAKTCNLNLVTHVVSACH